jgi:histidyl-tRNA synthetase
VDAEVIAMLLEFFRQLGLGDRVTLQLNSLGDGSCRPAYRERLVAYLRGHAAALCADCRERIDRNPLRVLDCKNPGCRPVLDAAPTLLDALCAPCADNFARVRAALEAMKIPYELNPRLVRGLDYYVRTAFELVTTALGAQNAVAGGGRYDGLIAQLGGPRDAATGFAIGMERVALLVGPEVAAPRPTALLVPIGETALLRLLAVAHEARMRGVGVDLANGQRKLRAELERAHKLGLALVVIVGDAELERGEATVREMASGQQRTVPLTALVDELQALGGRT